MCAAFVVRHEVFVREDRDKSRRRRRRRHSTDLEAINVNRSRSPETKEVTATASVKLVSWISKAIASIPSCSLLVCKDQPGSSRKRISVQQHPRNYDIRTKSLWGPFFVGARITTCSSSYFGAHRSFTGPSMSTKDPAPMKRPLLEISFLMVNWTVPFEMYLVTSTPAGTLSVQVKLFRSAQKLPHTSGQSSTPSFVISSSGTSKIR